MEDYKELAHINDKYFNQLVKIISSYKDPDYISNHIDVLKLMYDTTFSVVIDNDENRIKDAINFRHGVLNALGINTNKYFEDGSASLLEVMISLADRMSFIISDPNNPNRLGECFWDIFSNIGMHMYTNEFIQDQNEKAMAFYRDDVKCLMDRNYEYNGTGGFFPLIYANQDQRRVEIWYQMQAYLDEKYSI